ncbi:MAG: hypothetical protein GY873_20515 [Bosea sp.]|uniref:hypothetical protein n=1 Tax=Bosea sp. (in: a-proteobacteria) TaxID=1871050 RepID=UPI0023976167|nr:hypothetical protein [Bosea sp. (in: a-proteobacteria)]MCP4736572.1 hypothetical protein [Bosea sp. (in: a-proteobacteria)]
MPTDVASIEDLAEAEFEPWIEAAGDSPDSEKLDEQMRACIVTLRIAWRVMHSKKASLVTMFRTIDDELGASMKDDFISSIDWLKGALKLLDAAEVRLLSAGAVVELEARAAASADN